MSQRSRCALTIMHSAFSASSVLLTVKGFARRAKLLNRRQPRKQRQLFADTKSSLCYLCFLLFRMFWLRPKGRAGPLCGLRGELPPTNNGAPKARMPQKVEPPESQNSCETKPSPHPPDSKIQRIVEPKIDFFSPHFQIGQIPRPQFFLNPEP